MSLRSNERVCPIFGSGKDLPNNALPTYEDVIKCFIITSQLKGKQYRDLVRDTIEVVSTEIENIWLRASIPIVEHRTLVARVKAYHRKYRTILKPFKGRKNNEHYKKKIESKRLFDIATCKCNLSKLCCCSKDRKVPIKEREFLEDQRGERKMIIGGIDLKSTKLNMANISRKLKRNLHENSGICEISPSVELPVDLFCNAKKVKKNCKDLFAPFNSTTPLLSLPKNTTFPVLAKTLDRYGISDRSGAAIVSATLQDLGVVTENNTSNVVDRSKIRRARSMARKIATTANVPNFGEPCICISFDGRKDKTNIYEDNRRKVVIEEHITMLKEPDSKYIGHISVNSSEAKIIANKMFAYLLEKCNDLKSVVAFGCDGTIVNTGYKGGIIRLIEEKLLRPVQWLVCQLHANELLLRHLFHHLDGTTTGPKSFSGPIGKSLKTCENLPAVQFSALECILPDITKSRSELSTDQLYLLEICRAVNTGRCADSLAKRNPGNISHSRWLTTANRILRLYISSKSPSKNLEILAEFVLKVYAPMWFNIKQQPSCVHGAVHLYETIKRSRYLPKKFKCVIYPVIQRNGYFGHCENILIAMLADDRTHMQELALRRIWEIRQRSSNLEKVRVFKLPALNFDANDYTEMIDWENISEPPLTQHISDDIILKAIDDAAIRSGILGFRMMPCHTQATERCIKLVTESCLAVCGPERREGWIQNKLESMSIMPAFNTKKDYVT